LDEDVRVVPGVGLGPHQVRELVVGDGGIAPNADALRLDLGAAVHLEGHVHIARPVLGGEHAGVDGGEVEAASAEPFDNRPAVAVHLGQAHGHLAAQLHHLVHQRARRDRRRAFPGDDPDGPGPLPPLEDIDQAHPVGDRLGPHLAAEHPVLGDESGEVVVGFLGVISPAHGLADSGGEPLRRRAVHRGLLTGGLVAIDEAHLADDIALGRPGGRGAE